MELIPASTGTPFTAEAISCLSVSPNRRFIAVAEKSERGVVSIYDSSTLRRRKVLNFAELESKEEKRGKRRPAILSFGEEDEAS